jgi:hypothetical protein
MKTLIAIFLLVFLAIFGLYLVTITHPDLIGSADRAQLVRDALTKAVVPLWQFARPLLQLAGLLLILHAAIKYFGGRWSLEPLGIKWEIRSLIAIIVVTIFSIAALAGSEATGALKDVALVVIGFYFGQADRHQPAQPTEGASQVTPS